MEEIRDKCRVLIIGAQRARVAKVVSLISDDKKVIPVAVGRDESDFTDILIEYLPCVATFGSYENENGDPVRYLSGVQYHGLDGKRPRGSSLAPFFDAQDEETCRFSGVSAVAIGCGIECEQDVIAIQTFINSISAAKQPEPDTRPILIETVTHNSNYLSMKEENDAYKAMDADAKAEAIRLGTIGPGKMAHFVTSLATKVVHAAYPEANQTSNEGKLDNIQNLPKASYIEGADTVDETSITKSNSSSFEEVVVGEVPTLQDIDANRKRFACRMCRTILFGEDDLENPPHARATHGFSRRKGQVDSGECGSLFLSIGVAWMGEMSAAEGKFACPKCKSKLGSWKWAGTQCSCGSWVTPAIQVPLSKVDIVRPIQVSPPGALVASIPEK